MNENIINTVEEIIIHTDHSISDNLLKSNIFDLLFYNEYSTNFEYIYDKKINILDKNMKFNEKIVNIMNNQNSGFHAYQMVINTKTKTLVPLSEVVSIIISGNGINDITPFIHCGYHFNTTLKGSQYTCYSFHTSHSKFYHNNSIIQNIKYMENGIKFINPLTIMSTYEFNQYFAILNYQSLWPQYHKSIHLIEIYNQTMEGTKLALENNNWYIHKNNKIETYNKINDLEVTNEIINNFNEKINDKIYFKQFINHLAEKNEYPKAILKLINKKNIY